LPDCKSKGRKEDKEVSRECGFIPVYFFTLNLPQKPDVVKDVIATNIVTATAPPVSAQNGSIRVVV
jgi:hypothetical protein